MALRPDVAPSASKLSGLTTRRAERAPLPRVVVLCLTVTGAIAVTDTLTGERLTLIALLAVGPCMAISAGRWQPTAITSVWATGLAVALGAPDGIWATDVHLAYIAVVAVVGASSTAVTLLVEQRRHGEGTAADEVARPQPIAHQEVISTLPGISQHEAVDLLYRSTLGRAADPSGLQWCLSQLGHGASYEDVLDHLAASAEATEFRRQAGFESLRTALNHRWLARDHHEPTVVFLHIMRTAGTSLKQALMTRWPAPVHLVDVYLDDFVMLPTNLLSGFGLIAGHLPFEAVELIPSSQTVTVLRDPIERTLSHYSFIRRLPDVMSENPDLSLEEFLTSPRWSSLATNYQARHLGHRIGVTAAWTEYSPPARFASLGEPFPRAHPRPLQSFFDCSPIEMTDDDLYRTAVDHLDRIDVVGVTDRLQLVLDEVLGTRGAIEVPRPNRADGAVRVDDVPTRLHRLLDEQNSVDRALYEHARARAGELRATS